jgi:hypothetical protein
MLHLKLEVLGDGPRPRVPWLALEDWIIKVFMLGLPILLNDEEGGGVGGEGRLVTCLRYWRPPPQTTRESRQFYRDFWPVWKRNMRSLAQLRSRISYLLIKNNTDDVNYAYAGIAAAEFMVAAANEVNFPNACAIVSKILSLNLAVRTVSDCFSRSIMELSDHVRKMVPRDLMFHTSLLSTYLPHPLLTGRLLSSILQR